MEGCSVQLCVFVFWLGEACQCVQGFQECPRTTNRGIIYIMHVLPILLYSLLYVYILYVCVKKWLEYICGHIQLLFPLFIVLLLWHIIQYKLSVCSVFTQNLKQQKQRREQFSASPITSSFPPMDRDGNIWCTLYHVCIMSERNKDTII